MAPATVQQRIKFARGRLSEWGTLELQSHELVSWLGGFTGWTKVTYHGHLRSVYRWATVEGIVPADPTACIPRPPSPRPRPKPLSEDELRLSLEHASPDVRVWLLLGYLAGLRAHEIAKFDGQDITRNGIYVLGKGGLGWTVPTHPLLWEVAAQYPRSGYWFPSPFGSRDHISTSTVTHQVGKLFRSLGITGATHRARHTYGTQLLRGGANLRVVQELMRHASLATTALYLGVDEDEKWSAINGLGA